MEGIAWSGKALTEHKAKRHWRRKRWATTPPIGGKKGRQAQFADGRCWASRVPLSSAGQRMMSNCWAITLDSIVVVRPKPAAVDGKTCVRTRAMRASRRASHAKSAVYTPHVRQPGRKKLRACRKGQGRRPPLGSRTHTPLVVQPLPASLLVRYEKTAAIFWRCCNARAALICWPYVLT